MVKTANTSLRFPMVPVFSSIDDNVLERLPAAPLPRPTLPCHVQTAFKGDETHPALPPTLHAHRPLDLDRGQNPAEMRGLSCPFSNGRESAPLAHGLTEFRSAGVQRAATCRQTSIWERICHRHKRKSKER